MLEDYRRLTETFARLDGGVIAAAQIDDAVKFAVLRYSLDRPVVKVADFSTEGGSMLLPPDWEPGLSRISAASPN
jgi:nitrogen fixation protein